MYKIKIQQYETEMETLPENLLEVTQKEFETTYEALQAITELINKDLLVLTKNFTDYTTGFEVTEKFIEGNISTVLSYNKTPIIRYYIDE